MKELLYHWIVGNDTPAWIVAMARGLLTAGLAGATVFVTTWAQTEDVKLMISAPASVFLTVLTARLVAEGIIDTWKNGGA